MYFAYLDILVQYCILNATMYQVCNYIEKMFFKDAREASIGGAWDVVECVGFGFFVSNKVVPGYCYSLLILGSSAVL